MFRRPIQRRPPPGDLGSMSFLYDRKGSDTNALYKTRLLLTLPRNTPPEPLPYLDYHLLYLLIQLSHPHHSDPRFLKRYDYLSDARTAYYLGISKFQAAYEALLDADTHGKMLDQRFEALSQKLRELKDSRDSPDKDDAIGGVTQGLADIEIVRRKNNEALRGLLLKVEEKARKRDYATSWLSSLKWQFLRTQLPELVEMGKQVYAWKMGREGGEPRPAELVLGRQIEPVIEGVCEAENGEVEMVEDDVE